jgi:glycosyltransferase involved in cell wall biosynthesis
VCKNWGVAESRHVSVIIPAHNEGAGIGRLLSVLADPSHPDTRLELIVVCNGCSDDTADIARGWAPAVEVIELSEASKQAALAAGNAAARFPARMYCDADVIIDAEGVGRLVDALADGVHAVAPRRRLDVAISAWPVRAYYRFWERLPQVRSDLFGRGVIALSPEGVARVQLLPRVMSDDLAVSEAFTAEERRVVDDVEVVVTGPRTVRDLIRRRTRVATGNHELDRLGLRGASARTGLGSIGRLVRERPASAADALVFLGVTALARARSLARRIRGTSEVWLRDESSRSR